MVAEGRPGCTAEQRVAPGILGQRFPTCGNFDAGSCSGDHVLSCLGERLVVPCKIFSDTETCHLISPCGHWSEWACRTSYTVTGRILALWYETSLKKVKCT